MATLLESAKTARLQELAQAGAVGVIRPKGPRAGWLDRFSIHRGLCGVAPSDSDVSAGRCYAASAGVQLAKGETAWCCELVTQRDGVIIDPAAGRITTKESDVLIHSLEDRLGSDTRRWEIGRGSHHVLVAHEAGLPPDGAAPIRPPELLVGQEWKRQLPRGAVGDALAVVIEQGAAVLEEHPVNRVRADLGENPANLLWLWGAGAEVPARPFTDRTGMAGAVISSDFLMRGLAKTLGMAWKESPASLEERAIKQILKHLLGLLDAHDVVYVHLRVEHHDPVERLCAMERIDQLLLTALSEALPSQGPWRLVMAVDDRTAAVIPWIAIGTGLPQHPVARLTAQDIAGSPLAFEDSAALFTWLTQPA